MKMVSSVLLASILLLSGGHDSHAQKTGKWGRVRTLVGKAPPDLETHYGTRLAATISEGNLRYTDTPIKPNVYTSADIKLTWTNPKDELTPGDPLEFEVTAEAKVSEKDPNGLNLTGWFVFDGFKVVEQKNAWVGQSPNGFVGTSKGVFKVIVPPGAEGKLLHIWQGQTGLGFGSGGIWYPCQYWYKWNAKPIDPKRPTEPPAKKPEDSTKEKQNWIFDMVEYRELCQKASVDGEPPYRELSTGGRILRGVAADGSALVLLRGGVGIEGRVTFNIPEAGGGLIALTDSNLYRSKGSPTLKVNTVPVGGLHYAFALYRPPNTFGAEVEEKILKFVVEFDFIDPKAEDRTIEVSLNLVRPPVVLVHGTYDNPKFCFQDHDPLDDSPMSLEKRLRNAGFRVFCVDWEETNGSKNPSSFVHNSKAVWMNKNGIQTALDAMHKDNVAASQVDLVCHSQGGVIARAYARGYYLNDPIPKRHLTDPVECNSDGMACWYHRKDNHWSGDIHRLITISATHRGSEVCRLFGAFQNYRANFSPIQDINRVLVNAFLLYVDNSVSGITTDGFKNQTPGSDELRAIGPTPVPAHAIGCVVTNEKMETTRIDNSVSSITLGMGDYFGKLYKIWKLTPDDSKQFAFDYLGETALAKGDPKPKAMAEEYRKLSIQFEKDVQRYAYTHDNLDYRNAIRPLILHIRKLVFQDDENDCTVSFTSSCGGLKVPYITKAKDVLHGWAPRYLVVQNRVLQLLRDNGNLFDPNGFPDYDGNQSSISKFLRVSQTTSSSTGRATPSASHPRLSNTIRRLN